MNTVATSLALERQKRIVELERENARLVAELATERAKPVCHCVCSCSIDRRGGAYSNGKAGNE